jgi:predicted small metal-binding protein
MNSSFQYPIVDRGLGMEIKFRCTEMVGNERCDFVAQGITEDEVFKVIWEHYKTGHGLKPATKPMKKVLHWSITKKGWALRTE